MKKTILVLTTGGTIEKCYSEFEGSLLNRNTQLKERFLKKLRLPYADIQVQELMAKDSLQMNDEDRKYILTQVQKLQSGLEPIIILHGTDTMETTARYIFENLKEPKVAIVLTGAMKPIGFEDSDALQNFTEALMVSQVLAPGIYISFHGHLFHVPNVRKNLSKGTFERFDL